MQISRFIPLIALATLAGCAQDFTEKPLTAEEKTYEQTLLQDSSDEAKVALGQLYFMHNQIDQANDVLVTVVTKDPKNAQALAWYGANNCKKAGRRGPWLMGLDKMYLVNECLKQVDQALAAAPDDFTVQMIQMNTGVEVAMFGSLEKAAQTKTKVDSKLTATPQALPPDVQAQFYVVAARIERKLGNPKSAQTYLEQASRAASTQPTKESIETERKNIASL